jgi:hypothetical protein
VDWLDARGRIDLDHFDRTELEARPIIAISGVSRPLDLDKARAHSDARDAARIAGTSWGNLKVIGGEDGPSGHFLEQGSIPCNSAILRRPHDQIDAVRAASKQRIDIAFAISDHDDLLGIPNALGNRFSCLEPADRLLLLERPTAPLLARGPSILRARPNLEVQNAQHGFVIRVDRDAGMNEKSAPHPIAPRPKPNAASIPATQVDIGGILWNDDPPPRAALRRFLGNRLGDFLPRNFGRFQEAVTSHFPCAVSSDFLEHQRPRRKNPLEYPSATLIPPNMAKLTDRTRSNHGLRLHAIQPIEPNYPKSHNMCEYRSPWREREGRSRRRGA